VLKQHAHVVATVEEVRRNQWACRRGEVAHRHGTWTLCLRGSWRASRTCCRLCEQHGHVIVPASHGQFGLRHRSNPDHPPTRDSRHGVVGRKWRTLPLPLLISTLTLLLRLLRDQVLLAVGLKSPPHGVRASARAVFGVGGEGAAARC
jgi:hypothetical protein